MSIGNREEDNSSDEEAVEDRTFACPYCGEEFETAFEEGKCQATHFENTGSVTRRPRSDDKKKNLVDEWKRGEKQ